MPEIKEEQEPLLTQFARENPAAAVVPLGGLLGGIANTDKRKPTSSFLRGGVAGLGTGASALLGGTIGNKIAPEGGALGGGALGGLLGYLALHNVLHDPEEHKKEKHGVAPVLQGLLDAKQFSDQKEYDSKHRKLRALMEQYPDDFFIDSTSGNIVGVTHRPTGFRMHAPLHVLPPGLHNSVKPSEGVASEPATAPVR